jgi:hypothetical protein
VSTINEHQRVMLAVDLRGEKLTEVDVGTVVNIYRDGPAYEVEFLTLYGETVAVVTLEKAQLRAVDHREVTRARRLLILTYERVVYRG